MLITAGVNRDEHVTPHRWANDWISVRGVPGYRAILSPRNVRLSKAEIERFHASEGSPDVGKFWLWWRLEDDGTFTDLRPPRRRPVCRPMEEAHDVLAEDSLCLCQPVARICARCRRLGLEFGRAVAR